MAPEKIPIRQQVEEARCLALFHQHTYPVYVQRRRMRPAAAEHYLRTQRAIVATLEWVQDNEALLKAAVAAVQRLPRQEERERSARGAREERGGMSTHGPIQSDLRENMNVLGRFLTEHFKPYGFALLVFPFGSDPKGRMNYISNARRKDMLIAMKEFIARNEGFDPETPTAKQ